MPYTILYDGFISNQIVGIALWFWCTWSRNWFEIKPLNHGCDDEKSFVACGSLFSLIDPCWHILVSFSSLLCLYGVRVSRSTSLLMEKTVQGTSRAAMCSNRIHSLIMQTTHSRIVIIVDQIHVSLQWIIYQIYFIYICITYNHNCLLSCRSYSNPKVGPHSRIRSVIFSENWTVAIWYYA